MTEQEEDTMKRLSDMYASCHENYVEIKDAYQAGFIKANNLKDTAIAEHEAKQPEGVDEMIKFYQERISDIDKKYFFTQDEDKSKVDYKKRSKLDVELKSIYEDFIADLKRL